MKRFLVFAYSNYYPSGGVSDLHAAYDTEEEALAALPDDDCVEVLDTLTGVLRVQYTDSIYRRKPPVWGDPESVAEKLGIQT